MLHGPQKDLFDLSFSLPSECADRIETGHADIGIVPVVEIPRLGLTRIPGTGIACRGPVRSILLISRTKPEKIATLATDLGSRTSVALARIVLARRYGSRPVLVPMPPRLEGMLEAADAALVIGDAALLIDPSGVPFQVMDLGEEWLALTGLPMVFAMWAGPAAVARPRLEAAFTGSCRFGLANLEKIIAQEARRRGIGEDLARRYLTRHIVFELEERDYEGMDLFLQYTAGLDTLVASPATLA